MRRGKTRPEPPQFLGWRPATLAGICAGCQAPYLAGDQVRIDSTAGLVGQCCSSEGS